MPSITDSIGRVLGDRYRLVSPLGTGASAHVYLADDVSLHRRVAIKVLHPALAGDTAFLKRFRAEARAVAALNHPNVLQVYDWGEASDTPYLVLEYLAGGSLRQVYDTGALLTPEQAVHIGIQATAGLDYAHRRGLVHRDIKPANLLFDADSRLRIADFGLARALAEAAWTEPDGAILGTARYAAPEQVEGYALDGKADVYGLAIVLYEGVTGQAPFVGDTTVATLMARVGTLLPEHPALGPLNEVLVWAAAPNADERYDAAAFGVRLKALAADLPEPAPLPLIEAVPVVDAGAKVDLDKALVWPTRQAPAPGRQDTTELGLSHAQTERLAAAIPAGDDPATPKVKTPKVKKVRTARRRRWPWVVAAVVIVVALVAGGLAVAAHRGLFTPSHPIPSLVGRTVPAAVQATRADHFTVHQSGAEYSITAPTGQIISQQPTARSGGKATMAKQGAVISVVVSKGLPSVAIPSNLATYSTCGDATKALATIHLVGVCPATAEQYSATVPAGGVLGSTPTGTALYGSTVTIITSKGHAPVTVPVVTGAGTTYAAAAAAITAAGLVPAQSQAYSSTVPSGQVVSTSPAAGGQVPFGSTVTVTVSQGPQPVTIPSLIGHSLSSAVSDLQALGLKVATYGPGSSGIVVFTSPSSGTSVLPGTTVTVDFV
jgi:beta-lactam-binding protein with PASTA domain/tRNA A-37 threonylcarbamoyl transferase component Bud32